MCVCEGIACCAHPDVVRSVGKGIGRVGEIAHEWFWCCQYPPPNHRARNRHDEGLRSGAQGGHLRVRKHREADAEPMAANLARAGLRLGAVSGLLDALHTAPAGMRARSRWQRRAVGPRHTATRPHSVGAAPGACHEGPGPGAGTGGRSDAGKNLEFALGLGALRWDGGWMKHGPGPLTRLLKAP